MEDDVIKFEGKVAEFLDPPDLLLDVRVHFTFIRLTLTPVPDETII
mgnify:FL=1